MNHSYQNNLKKSRTFQIKFEDGPDAKVDGGVVLGSERVVTSTVEDLECRKLRM